jgi:hypothetical protein
MLFFQDCPGYKDAKELPEQKSTTLEDKVTVATLLLHCCYTVVIVLLLCCHTVATAGVNHFIGQGRTHTHTHTHTHTYTHT